MNDFMDGIQSALEYIEENLTDDIDISDIAARAYLSPFYFQRVFHATIGLTVGEYETRTFEAGAWAVFSYHGKCPEALQTVNTQIWTEWLPNSLEYELAGNYNIEFYASETEGEIWVPVKRK